MISVSRMPAGHLTIILPLDEIETILKACEVHWEGQERPERAVVEMIRGCLPPGPAKRAAESLLLCDLEESWRTRL